MSFLQDAQQTFMFVVGDPSPWRLPRLIFAIALSIVVVVLWKCSQIVEPEEQAMRVTFGRIRFRYDDTGEGSWLKRFGERHENKRKVRALRKGPDCNKPHWQLDYGEPIIYGPGRYMQIPFSLSYKKQDVRNVNLDMDIPVQNYEKFTNDKQPIQVVVRITSLYLWHLVVNDVNGTLGGIANRTFKEILFDLGHQRFINEGETVCSNFRDIVCNEFAYYGAEVATINLQTPVPSTDAYMARAFAEKNFSPGSIGLNDDRPPS